MLKSNSKTVKQIFWLSLFTFFIFRRELAPFARPFLNFFRHLCFLRRSRLYLIASSAFDNDSPLSDYPVIDDDFLLFEGTKQVLQLTKDVVVLIAAHALEGCTGLGYVMYCILAIWLLFRNILQKFNLAHSSKVAATTGRFCCFVWLSRLFFWGIHLALGLLEGLTSGRWSEISWSMRFFLCRSAVKACRRMAARETNQIGQWCQVSVIHVIFIAIFAYLKLLTFFIRCDQLRGLVRTTLIRWSDMNWEHNASVINAFVRVFGFGRFFELIKVITLPKLIDPFSLPSPMSPLEPLLAQSTSLSICPLDPVNYPLFSSGFHNAPNHEA